MQPRIAVFLARIKYQSCKLKVSSQNMIKSSQQRSPGGLGITVTKRVYRHLRDPETASALIFFVEILDANRMFREVKFRGANFRLKATAAMFRR